MLGFTFFAGSVCSYGVLRLFFGRHGYLGKYLYKQQKEENDA